MKKKKLITIISILILSCVVSFPSHARDMRDETETEYPMGIIPSDMKVGDPIVSKSYIRGNGSGSGVTDLPGSLDGRTLGYVTSVKSQGNYGSCWSFATNAALESAILKKGLADTGINLSELHTIYFMYNNNYDPFGRISEDRNYISVDRFGRPVTDFSVLADIGGRIDCAGWQMTNGAIPLEENGEDYNNCCADRDFSVNPLDCFASDYMVRKMLICNFNKDNIDNVKNLIYKYGGVAVDFYCEQTTVYSGSSKYFNQVDGTKNYYNPNGVSYRSTHGVEIVGWDDDYPKEKFKQQPAGNGAWLVKNSWGTSDDNDGFLWLSYYDECQDAKAVAYDVEKKEAGEAIYQYDGSDHFSYYPYKSSSSAYYLAIFKADSPNPGEAELIKRVGVGSDANASFTVSILTDPVISNGRLVSYKEKAVTSCTSPYSGYEVFDLSEEVTVEYGDTFAVMVKADPDTTIYAAGSLKPDRKGFPGCTETVKEGQYLYGLSTNGLSTPDGSPCIRAYGVAERPPVVMPTPTPTPDVTPTPKATIAPTASPTAQVTATPDIKPSASPSAGPTAVPTPNQTPGPDNPHYPDKPEVYAPIGSTWTTSIGRFKVTGKKTVAYTGSLNKDDKEVTIPATVVIYGKDYLVTEISPGTFKGNKNLKKVIIGPNVKTIGAKSFYGCKKLKTVIVNSSKIKKIGSKAFKGIYKKVKFYLPKKKLSNYKKKLKKAGTPKKAKYKKN